MVNVLGVHPQGCKKKHVFLLQLLFAVSLFIPVVWATEPSPSRQMELRNLLKNDCGACHGLTLQGGMGPALLPEKLAGKSDELLVTTILEGRKGTAMPPWKPFMNRDEVVWLLGVLQGRR
jgi:cytochrome c55X